MALQLGSDETFNGSSSPMIPKDATDFVLLVRTSRSCLLILPVSDILSSWAKDSSRTRFRDEKAHLERRGIKV